MNQTLNQAQHHKIAKKQVLFKRFCIKRFVIFLKYSMTEQLGKQLQNKAQFNTDALSNKAIIPV